MARDKGKDDALFNCSQEHEKKYVASLYPNPDKVYDFLSRKCADRTIYHYTHKQVYALIERELGYAMPH